MIYFGNVLYRCNTDVPSGTVITVREGTTQIFDGAYDGKSGVSSFIFPASLEVVGESALFGTTWFDNQPNGPVYAGNVLFWYKGTVPANTHLAVKAGTKSISQYAFSSESGLTSITIPNSVKFIGGSAFYKTGLTSIELPEGLQYVERSLCQGCSSLESVTLPSSVKRLYNGAFYQCPALKYVRCEAEKVPKSRDNRFDVGSLKSMTLEVPATAVEAYRNATGWCNFGTIQEYTVPYSLYIAGTQVTSDNASDILGDGGKAAYDWRTQTLTFTDATVRSSDSSIVRSGIAGLTINLRGKNELSYTGSNATCYGIETDTRLTLTSDVPGSKATIQGYGAAIRNNMSGLVIVGQNFNLSLYLVGRQYGIRGASGDYASSELTINRAEVRISSTNSGAIVSQESLNLNGVKIQNPGVYFSSASGDVVDGNGNRYTKELLLSYDRYPLYVLGDEVNEFNKDDILGDGTMNYEPDTKTLTLDGVRLYGDVGQDLISIYSDVTIKVLNHNYLSANNANCIYSSDDLTYIEGSLEGSYLTMESTDASAIYAESGLSVRDVTRLEASTLDCSAAYLNDEPLKIQNANCYFSTFGDAYPTISSCSAVSLLDSVGMYPHVEYDASAHQFVDKDGNVFAGTIVFEKKDVNNDQRIDKDDVEALSALILQKPGYEELNRLDFNEDGDTSVGDIVTLIDCLENVPQCYNFFAVDSYSHEIDYADYVYEKSTLRIGLEKAGQTGVYIDINYSGSKEYDLTQVADFRIYWHEEELEIDPTNLDTFTVERLSVNVLGDDNFEILFNFTKGEKKFRLSYKGKIREYKFDAE